jgi:hypothetical protein
MNGKASILILHLFVSLQLPAQMADEGYYQLPSRDDFRFAGRWARFIPYRGDPDSLAYALTARFDNPYLKYKSIYAWIAYHIAYDVEAIQDASKRFTDPLMVLDSMRAVCGGYSSLMCFLCGLAGLDCEIVVGYARNEIKHLGGVDWLFPEHAWNAILINDEWSYCDVTWGAGALRGDSLFIQCFSGGYFNMSAEKMFLQHYPIGERWHRDYTMSPDEFDIQPLYHGAFFVSRIDGFNKLNKHLTKGFLNSLWIRFESTSRFESLYVRDKHLTFPPIRIGRQYILGVSPREKGDTIHLMSNKVRILSYIEK